MEPILVSVVIPVYNSAGFVSDAIDSALAQNVPLEVIVIDDKSTDNIDIVKEKYIHNERVVFLKNDDNLGVAKTRNFGVSVAKGDFVAFLDADDIWAEHKLEKQLDAISQTGTVLCATARELINHSGESLGKVIHVKDIITYKELLKHNSINCSSVLLKTEVAREFPMHHDDCHEDYIMWLEILQKYGKVCGIDEPLLKYRVSNSGKSGSKLKSAVMTFKVYRYMGFDLFKSIFCFISYAVNGVKKHYFADKEK